MTDPIREQSASIHSPSSSLDVRAFFRRLGPAGPLAVVAASLPAVGGWALLGTAVWVAPWLKEQGAAGVLVYVLGFAVLSGFAVLPTYAQAVVGGWAFGMASGAGAAITGFLGGAIIGYAVARAAAGDRVVTLISEHAKWQAVYDELIACRFWKSLGIVTLLRLPPNSPFAITNLVLAATKVRPSVYVLGTLFGMTPRTAAFAFIGAAGAELTSVSAKPTWLIIAGAALMILVVGAIGVMANRAIARIAQA